MDNRSSVEFLRRNGLIPDEFGKTPAIDGRIIAQDGELGDVGVNTARFTTMPGVNDPGRGQTYPFPPLDQDEASTDE